MCLISIQPPVEKKCRNFVAKPSELPDDRFLPSSPNIPSLSFAKGIGIRCTMGNVCNTARSLSFERKSIYTLGEIDSFLAS